MEPAGAVAQRRMFILFNHELSATLNCSNHFTKLKRLEFVTANAGNGNSNGKTFTDPGKQLVKTKVEEKFSNDTLSLKIDLPLETGKINALRVSKSLIRQIPIKGNLFLHAHIKFIIQPCLGKMYRHHQIQCSRVCTLKAKVWDYLLTGIPP